MDEESWIGQFLKLDKTVPYWADGFRSKERKWSHLSYIQQRVRTNQKANSKDIRVM